MILITPKDIFDSTKVTELVELQCVSCHCVFTREKRAIQKVLKHISIDGPKKNWGNFCGKSCSAKHNNQHVKKKGDNRSKLERWIETKLNILYPNLEIHYSRRDTINAELDIYIPSLKLAFELNGVFHYEPIFGEDRLKSAKTNDERKFQACIENNIELCIINTTKLSGKFTDIKCEPYLKIVTDLINLKYCGAGVKLEKYLI
jgi:hypothetical protein